MSLIIPKTWTTGEVLTAEDINDNLHAVKSKQHKTASSDWDIAAKTAWYDTNHIMDSRYSPTDNLSTNVSGVFGGHTNGSIFQNMTYCTRWISERYGSSIVRQYVPMSCITFDILNPCTILFQWSMVSQSAKDGDGTDGVTIISAGINNLSITGINTSYRVAEQPNGSTHNVLVDGTRQTNGVILVDVSSPVKQYSIGLVGRSTAGKCQNVSWSVSLECFYI